MKDDPKQGKTVFDPVTFKRFKKNNSFIDSTTHHRRYSVDSFPYQSIMEIKPVNVKDASDDSPVLKKSLHCPNPNDLLNPLLQKSSDDE